MGQWVLFWTDADPGSHGNWTQYGQYGLKADAIEAALKLLNRGMAVSIRKFK